MKKILIALLVSLSFTVSLCVYASFVQKDISQNVIRLHVIANSDNDFDQKIKHKVKDSITAALSSSLENSKSIAQSELIINSSLEEIEKAANDVLQKYGADYSAEASLCIRDFPTKKYENITLPAGTYKALCINLGKAEGKNWWCVMYPPLCLNSSTLSMPKSSTDYLKKNLSQDSFAIVNTDDDSDLTVVYRFKIFDYISHLKKYCKGY